MRSKYIVSILIFFSVNLLGCNNINFDSLEYIDKSGLSNCSKIEFDTDGEEVNKQMDSVEITTKRLLTVMQEENTKTGKQITLIFKKLKALKNKIESSKNLYKDKTSVIEKSKKIKDELKTLNSDISTGKQNLEDVQNKVINTFCNIKKLYKIYNDKYNQTDIESTKKDYQYAMDDISVSCQKLYNLLKNINTFMKSFKKLETSINQTNNAVFALVSSVITFTSNDKKCNKESCVYDRVISLDVMRELMTTYMNNADILIKMNTNYGRRKDEE